MNIYWIFYRLLIQEKFKIFHRFVFDKIPGFGQAMIEMFIVRRVLKSNINMYY
jgi:hypothetical protein